MRNLMSHEEEFELALQEYEKAVAVYKIAQLRYMEAVGPFVAQRKFEESINRICRLDTPVVIMPQEESERRAKLAKTVIDSDVSADSIDEETIKLLEPYVRVEHD